MSAPLLQDLPHLKKVYFMLVMYLLEHGQVASSPGEGESFSTCTLAKPSVVESQATAARHQHDLMNFLVAFGDNMGHRHQHALDHIRATMAVRDCTDHPPQYDFTCHSHPDAHPTQAAKVMTSPRHQSVAQTAFMALRLMVAWGSSMDH